MHLSRPARIGWATGLRALVIVAVVFAIYAPVFHGEWLIDDDLNITGNLLLHDPHRLWKIWFVPGSQVEYYPIEATVIWAQWQLWQNDTLGYHLTSIGLHALSALLLWRLLARFGLKLAWLGGLLFAVHPIMVESVAWITELKNTLSLPPLLLAITAWIDFEARGRRRDYRLALVFFLVALLCKISVALFPAVILLYAWWKRGRIGWSDLKTSAPFFLITLVAGLLNYWAGVEFWKENMIAVGQAIPNDFLSQAACAGRVLWFYLATFFYPVGLLPLYEPWTVTPASPWPWLSWMICGGGIAWFWIQRRSWGRHALLGLGFYLFNLVPVIGFMAMNYRGMVWSLDHLGYVPVIGWIGLIVAGLGWIETRLAVSFRNGIPGGSVILCALLAWESHNYAAKFMDQETLWTYTLRFNPDAGAAHNNLGLVYLDSGRFTQAAAEFTEAARLTPGYAVAYNNLGIALVRLHRIPDGIAQYEKAIQLTPDYEVAHRNLGDALMEAGRTSEGIAQFQTALQMAPEDPSARNNFGAALMNAGMLDAARQQLEAGLRINPNIPETHYNLGNVFFQAGQFAEAAGEYTQALKINPRYGDARCNLGVCLAHLGHLPEAIAELEEALRLDPANATAQKNLVKLQAIKK
jgi:tetratricopeptide (TPR) repeat protein